MKNATGGAFFVLAPRGRPNEESTFTGVGLGKGKIIRGSHFGKYRENVFAVAFFLVFDWVVLCLNFYFFGSYEISLWHRPRF